MAACTLGRSGHVDQAQCPPLAPGAADSVAGPDKGQAGMQRRPAAQVGAQQRRARVVGQQQQAAAAPGQVERTATRRPGAPGPVPPRTRGAVGVDARSATRASSSGRSACSISTPERATVGQWIREAGLPGPVDPQRVELLRRLAARRARRRPRSGQRRRAQPVHARQHQQLGRVSSGARARIARAGRPRGRAPGRPLAAAPAETAGAGRGSARRRAGTATSRAAATARASPPGNGMRPRRTVTANRAPARPPATVSVAAAERWHGRARALRPDPQPDASAAASSAAMPGHVERGYREEGRCQAQEQPRPGPARARGSQRPDRRRASPRTTCSRLERRRPSARASGGGRAPRGPSPSRHRGAHGRGRRARRWLSRPSAASAPLAGWRRARRGGRRACGSTSATT